MLPKHLDEVLQDIRLDRDVTSRLREVFQLPPANLPRAQRLAFTKAVVSATAELQSENGHHAFSEAINSLRTLAQFLKAKGQPLLHTVATIEKYSVNHAVQLCFGKEVQSKTVLKSVNVLMEKTLKSVFEARQQLDKTNMAEQQKEREEESAEKENSDPSCLGNGLASNTALLERLAYGGASTNFEELMPQNDSAAVAAIVCGALTTRLIVATEDVHLRHLLTFVQSIVTPWLQHLSRLCHGAGGSYHRNYLVYAKRVQKTLLRLCHRYESDPCVVLKARCHALTLGDVKLNQYARDLLRTAHFATRSKSPCCSHGENIYDLVGSVYDEAELFVSKFPFTDPHWMSEDVSAWLDHIAIVWERRSCRTAVPRIFSRRVAALRKNANLSPTMIDIFELQVSLLKSNAYDTTGDLLLSALATELPRFKVPFVASTERSDPSKRPRKNELLSIQSIGLERLRLLRTLEHCRKSFRTSDTSGNESSTPKIIHDVFAVALRDGLLRLKPYYRSFRSDQPSDTQEIFTRLEKMICSGLESVKEVLRVCIEEKDAESTHRLIETAFFFLQLHKEGSGESIDSLTKWIIGSVLVYLQSALRKSEAGHGRHISEDAVFIAEASSTVIQVFCDSSGTCISASQHMGFLELCRACSVTLEDWTECARVSLQMLTLLVRSEDKSTQQKGRSVLQEVCCSFARDYSLALEKNCSSALKLDESCSPGLALLAALEYSSWVKESSPPWHDTRKARDSVCNALRIRQKLLELLAEITPPCAQRKLHMRWLRYLLSETDPSNSMEDHGFTELSEVEVSKDCEGHETFAAHIGEQIIPSCDQSHIDALSVLSEIVHALAEGSEIQGDMLPRLQEVLSTPEYFLQDDELFHFASEILEWATSHLSLEERFEDAALIHDFACTSRSQVGLTTEPVPVLVLCKLLVDGGSSVRERSRLKIKSNRTANGDDEINDYSFTAGVCCSTKDSQVASIEAASRELKTSLMTIIRSSWPEEQALSKTWSVAGVDLDVYFDPRIVPGQAKLCQLLRLLRCLYSLALTLISADSLADGRYYLERCVDLAKCCLPACNYFLRSIAALYKMVGVSRVEVSSQDEAVDLMDEGSTDPQNARDLSAKQHYMRTTCGIALKELSSNLTSTLDASSGEELLRLHQDWEDFLDVNGEKNESKQEQALSEQYSLSTAATYAFSGDHSIAIDVLKRLSMAKPPFHIEIISLYLLARTYIHRTGALSSFLHGGMEDAAPRTGLRMTRSRARKQRGRNVVAHVLETRDVIKELIVRARTRLVNSNVCPQLFRRIWNLSGMLEDNPEESVSALNRSIGCSFDIRWRAVQAKITKKAEIICHPRSQNDTNTLDDAFAKLSIASETNSHDSDLASFLALLRFRGCVVIGLSVDETRSTVALWRMSGNGFITKKLSVPKTGETSIAGVLRRLGDVMQLLKETSVKSGQGMTQKEKQDWWNHRYALDEDIRTILSDVELHWLGDLKALLLPTVYDEESLHEHARCEEENDPAKVLINFTNDIFPEACVDDVSHKIPEISVTDECASKKKQYFGQLVLVTDTVLERIPWESIPMLRNLEVGVTRTPSLHFLKHHLMRAESRVDPNSLFYVINPAGDLLRTEETFKELLEPMAWKGSFGATSKERVLNTYNGEDIYLYCGHGAGDQFLSPRRFAKTGEAPIGLLMGCSSARPDNQEMADCENNGSAVDFLIHGSRAVVANLWDVTDKDIDRFTSSMLSDWLGLGDVPSQGHANLAEAVATSRSTCRLPFLVGSAAIVMGAPNIIVDRSSSQK